jgi:murein DD-endopeptidase MepM/ murein hydrolase activator NlpD
MADEQESLSNAEFVTFVLIDHGDGTYGRYYHLRGGSVRVKVGQPVVQGEILAQAGRTGRCQSQQLHFEVLRKDSRRLWGCPKIYWRWQTIPVDFEETRHLPSEEIPGRWLVSNNGAQVR